MKTTIVSYTLDTLPALTDEDREDLRRLAALPDSEIDFSDIPEWTKDDFKKAFRPGQYRPLKSQITAKVDRDVLEWLKADGPGYQSRMNAILRREMLKAMEEQQKAA